MNNKEILQAILSKDPVRLAEAKQGLKDILNAKAAEFRAGATKFAGRKIFESQEPVNETHTLNGPFPVGTVVKDSLKGICGVVKAVTGDTGHIHAVAFGDNDESNYGPEDIHRLKQADADDSLTPAIKALQGKFPMIVATK